MSRRSENTFTGGALILGLAASGTGVWVMTGGAKYIATHDPVDVIADLDAKLALIDLHDSAAPHRCPAYDQYPGTERFIDPDPRGCTHPCATLRVLAQPFAGHSDHKGEGWTP